MEDPGNIPCLMLVLLLGQVLVGISSIWCFTFISVVTISKLAQCHCCDSEISHLKDICRAALGVHADKRMPSGKLTTEHTVCQDAVELSL